MKNLAASLLLLPTILRTAIAAPTSTACNNSPSLCSKQYNDITHLGAHDSPFVRDAADLFTPSGDQFYNSIAQLNAGVRLLTAQVFNNNGEWHLCHTSCALLDAGKLSDWLGGIKSWLDEHTSDVVTVLLVNGDNASADQLATEYEAAGVVKYSYTPTSTSASMDWPTLDSLITGGTRLLTFLNALSPSSSAPYLMSEFDYIFENNYDNTSPQDFSCNAARPATAAANTLQAVHSGMMPLMNHFLYTKLPFNIEVPDLLAIKNTNAPSGKPGNLGDTANQCAAFYGKAPTFILVDFFNYGPAIATVDRLNGVTNPVGRTQVSANTNPGAKANPSPWLAMCAAGMLASALVVDLA